MDFEKLANEFIKQHEGVGYQSQPQMVAVRAFAKWLSENASQQSRALDAAYECPKCGTMLEKDGWCNQHGLPAQPRQ